MAKLQNLGLQGAGEGGATSASQNPAEAERCKVPAFAKTIGQKPGVNSTTTVHKQ